MKGFASAYSTAGYRVHGIAWSGDIARIPTSVQTACKKLGLE